MNKFLVGAATVLSAAMLAPMANAQVVGAAGQTNLAFASLSSTGLNGGSLATLVGGKVYTSDQPFADIPKGGISGGNFLAVGPTAGEPATLTFNQPINLFGFLIGSPDTYNQVTITSTVGAYTFSPTMLGLPGTGDQTLSRYVNFTTTTAGERILSATFTNNPAIDAFETANFSAGLTGAVPETASWAMMIVGMGAVGFAMRRKVRASEVKFDAKIKRIAAGDLA
jgi:hypothetical protein